MTASITVQYATTASDLPTEHDFITWALAALPIDLHDSVELTIRIVDEQESAHLNERYRHKKNPTNVLSFPFSAPPGWPLACLLLGDLVICAPVVQREAQQQNRLPFAHWAHMVIHGVLHLRGFDHQLDDQAQVMENLEIQLLHQLGFLQTCLPAD
jgi:probable rRNA maturation factor